MNDKNGLSKIKKHCDLRRRILRLLTTSAQAKNIIKIIICM